jgi:phosphatidylglycerol:prolipoprotein diacylglycerol transferase
MVALAFITAALLASRLAPKYGIPPERITTLSLIILLSGIFGARLFYIALNIKDFAAEPLEALKLAHGGLAFHGGAAAAFIFGLIYVRKARMPLWDTLDLLAPYIALGHAIGRIGCLLNGCCYGRLMADGMSRYPAQACSSLSLVFLYCVLRVRLRYRKFPGEVFILYAGLYSAGRFFVEFIRADSAPVLSGLKLAQLISIALFVAAAVAYLLGRRGKG